ncbi:MAG TPA: hypothetical protein ENI20_08045 [Bacteroides sp.]|nr:hypothetical protein [Bacteroides sp.]
MPGSQMAFPRISQRFAHEFDLMCIINQSVWIDNRNGNWICLDWKTGEVMYGTEWICKGSFT